MRFADQFKHCQYIPTSYKFKGTEGGMIGWGGVGTGEQISDIESGGGGDFSHFIRIGILALTHWHPWHPGIH